MRGLLILTFAAGVLMGASGSSKSSCVAPIRIGVIDTGFGFKNLGHDAPLCKYGHKDFSNEGSYGIFNTKVLVPEDTNGHGTNIVGLINEYALQGTVPYCFVILKYYSDKQDGKQNVAASERALQYANNLKLDVINYSGGGPNYSQKEYLAIKALLDRGALFVAAAGNEGEYLGIVNSYFPAMYDYRITVVGNMDQYGNRAKSSNYGPRVSVWEVGVDRTAYKITASGTSQATAVVTGKKVAAITKTCDR